LTARPEYYGMLAFSLAGRGQMLRLTVPQTGIHLSAYATKIARGDIWVTVINQDLATVANLEITLPEDCSTASACRLSAPSVESKSNVTLAGKEVSADGTWTPGITEPVPVKAGVADLQLPPASAVLVHFR
jgi:hypothetical protein